MQRRNTQIYYTLDDNMNFQFPESIDTNKIAIALNGGGIRTMACSMGYFRCLLRHDPKIMNKISYISTISGSSWFIAILLFGNCNLNNLLGESIPIYDINKYTLKGYNFDKCEFMGHVMTNCQVTEPMLNARRLGISAPQAWEYTCSKNFLYPYGIDGKFVCDSKESMKAHKKINNIDCVFPPKNYPFWICNSAVVDKQLTYATSCEFTPLYSGVRVPNYNYGGLYLESQGFGANFKKIPHKECRQNLCISPYNNNLLDNFIACSSCAYGVPFLQCYKENRPLSVMLKELNPITDLWGIMSDRDHEMNIIDGYYFDGTGIINLAARGCKKILAFINCGKFNSYCDLGISHLFGLESKMQCYTSNLRRKLAIFSSEDWDEMKIDFEQRIEDGKIPYLHKKLKVLPNWHAGVNGNYETELLIIPLLPNCDFIEQLQFDHKSEEYSELREFPNFSTFYIDGSVEINFTKRQVNMLSTYCDWLLTEIIEEIPCFFEESN